MTLRSTIMILLVFAFTFSGIKVSEAQSDTDSLKEARQANIHDTLKVRTDVLLGQAFIGQNFDSSLFYFNRALDLSKAIEKEFPRYRGLVLEDIGVAFYVGPVKRDTLMTYLKMAMEAHKRNELLEEVSKTQYNLATYYGNFSMYDSAAWHYDQIIERNLTNSTSTLLARSYNYSGLNYFYLRRLDKASERILDAIRYRKESGDTARIHYPYMVYGLILKEQGQYEEGKSYIRKSGEIAGLSRATRRVALAHTNIGQILIKQDSLDAAFESLTQAWRIDEKLGRSPVGYYNNIAWIEKQRKDYRKNHGYMLQAVGSIPEGYAPKSTADVYGSFVEAKILLADSVYYDFSNEQMRLLNEGVPYLEKGWELANQVNSGNVKLKIAEISADLYSKLNRYDRAFEFSQIAKEISEEINDQARTDAIAKMTTEFETERIEGQNTLLRETQQTQAAQLKQQNFVIFGGIVVLFLIIVIAAIIYRGRLRIQKANVQIEKSLSEKELLLKEIHHRVKNNLQVVSSLLDLQSRGIENEEALATFTEGQNRVKAMALIHQKLYQNENLATINFEDYAKLLIGELGTIYQNGHNIKTEVRSDSHAEFDIDVAVPLGLILNELISNAYKYAFNDLTEGELAVSIRSLGEGKHQLTIEDNGAGLPEAFDFDKAKSLGLRLVRRLAKQLYGSVTYSYDEGAKFVIIFTDTIQRKAV